jgi:integrase
MNRAAYDVLSVMPGSKTEGLVFRKRTTGEAWDSIRTAFESSCREAKVPDFHFHDLRHTCASWLVILGRTSRRSRRSLERQFSMTLRSAHLSPGRLRDAVAALDGLSTNQHKAR